MDTPTAAIAGRIEPLGRPQPPVGPRQEVADLIARIEVAMRSIQARPPAGANDRAHDYSVATRRALP